MTAPAARRDPNRGAAIHVPQQGDCDPALGGDGDRRGCAYNALWLFTDAGWRAVADVARAVALGLRISGGRRRFHGLAIWIVPVILGGVFIALRPGGAATASPLIRGLVYLWVAQNVMLVLSSLLRLDLYVAVYSLTYLRVAAFIWMVLVAAGLMLIVARIRLDRSTAWLVTANLISLAVVLYLCSFISLPRLIADYNVRHSAQMAGTGVGLDFGYVMGLGPQAIPAVDRYIAAVGPARAGRLVEWRATSASFHRRSMDDWRAWTYEDWRLSRYLAATAAAQERGDEGAPPAPAIP